MSKLNNRRILHRTTTISQRSKASEMTTELRKNALTQTQKVSQSCQFNSAHKTLNNGKCPHFLFLFSTVRLQPSPYNVFTDFKRTLVDETHTMKRTFFTYNGFINEILYKHVNIEHDEITCRVHIYTHKRRTVPYEHCVLNITALHI